MEKCRDWTTEEDRYIRNHWKCQNDAEMAAPQAARTATAVQNSDASSLSIAPAAAQPSMSAQKIVSARPAEKQEETRRRGAGTAKTPVKENDIMKKTVEMTYCDHCSTEIAPEVLENYEGFDLCRPCAEELRRRIHEFVSELKVPEQPEAEATIEPVKPSSAETIPAPEPEAIPQRDPEQEEYGGFLHLKCSGCGATKTFCAKKPMSVYHCYDCGADTELTNNMTPVYANCECGKRSRYMTNVTEWGFDLTCVVCGAPVAVEYRPGVNQYQTCGKSFVKSRKRKK